MPFTVRCLALSHRVCGFPAGVAPILALLLTEVWRRPAEAALAAGLASNRTGGALWDDVQASSYFNYEDEHGARFQVQPLPPSCPSRPDY
jgi:hypothetical protein